MTGQSEEEWSVACSDEESLDPNNQRMAPTSTSKSGAKVWEPEGAAVAQLYLQLERKGYIDLKWQCPGRRSPSVHSNSQGNEKKTFDLKETLNKNPSHEPNQFDFDDDLFDAPSKAMPTVSRRRSTQGPKKVAKLDKVMHDIKKYQIMDQVKKPPSESFEFS